MRNFLFIFIITCPLLSQDEQKQYDESFDPTTLNEPEMELPILIFPGDTFQFKTGIDVTDSTEMGYRIQVVSTPDYQDAELVMQELTQIMKEKVYLSFDPPNHKVRMGNFRFRSEAEKVQKNLTAMGYRTAWIIRTNIVVIPKLQQE